MEQAKAKQLTGHGGDTGPGPAVGGRWLERVDARIHGRRTWPGSAQRTARPSPPPWGPRYSSLQWLALLGLEKPLPISLNLCASRWLIARGGRTRASVTGDRGVTSGGGRRPEERRWSAGTDNRWMGRRLTVSRAVGLDRRPRQEAPQSCPSHTHVVSPAQLPRPSAPVRWLPDRILP